MIKNNLKDGLTNGPKQNYKLSKGNSSTI